MAGWLSASALVAAVVVSGCLGPTQGDGARDTPDAEVGGTETGSVAIFDCQVHEVVVPVPMEEVESIMPTGFHPSPGVVPSTANLVLGPNVCAGHTVDGTDAGPFGFTFFIIQAEPPAHLREERVDLNVVTLALVTDTPSWAERARSWGGEVQEGSTWISTPPAGPEGGLVEVEGERARATIVGSAPVEPAGTSRYLVRFWTMAGEPFMDAYLHDRAASQGAAAVSADGLPFDVRSEGIALYTNQAGMLVEMLPAGAPAPSWTSTE